MTGATLFSGGGGADLGMAAAGLGMRWGVEYDDNIASVARKNGLPIQTDDVTTADPADFEAVDCLHASPPCQSFSVAKADREELESDREIARATVRFIEHIQPRIFTLEQVWGYRKSESWQIIQSALTRLGYDWNAWHINTANFGVAQTRKRMFVAAVLGGPRPTKPPATHAEDPPPPGLFSDELKQWVGWYEAIEDLIPDLPDTEFADWQKERLPDEIKTMLVNESSTLEQREATEPAASQVASERNGSQRAVLVDTQQTSRNASEIKSYSPAMTVQAWHGRRPSHMPVATTQYRIVQMTPRCLARFQSFPDSYALPSSKSLACRIIGNAVPPLFQQRLYEHLTASA